MVTPELVEYIRAEIAKKKTREEIHKDLIYSGGWSESDLSEAFRTIIPMQSFIQPTIQPIIQPGKLSTPVSTSTLSFSLFKSTPKPSSFPPSFLKVLIILIVLGGLGFGAWYYRLPIIGFWNSSVSNLKKIQLPSFDLSFLNKSKDIVLDTPVENHINNTTTPTPVVQPVIQVKDCGVGMTPKLDTPSSYKNDVLSCLGESALICENAKGVLKDDFFPTIFEITKLQNSCNFKLSYEADSILIDINGKKLAGQYISCPINIVKAIDNTNPTVPKFTAPDKTDLSKYGCQIYFYGILGLFLENNLDQNKIQGIGCEGSYIQSMIASYKLSQKK